MAKKAKKAVEDEDLEADEAEDEGDEEEDAPKSKKAKKAKGKDKAKKAAKSKSKDDDEDGLVTIEALAEEAEITPQSARVKLREAELDKPEGGRWRWKDGSKSLKEARKVLGL